MICCFTSWFNDEYLKLLFLSLDKEMKYMYISCPIEIMFLNRVNDQSKTLVNDKNDYANF